MKCTAVLLLLLCATSHVKCWDNEELEIFDLVEEINKNFYELMGLQQDATPQEIKRAFRNLSVVLHPDKNDAEDANVVFRNLVSVYEVLKDPGKREKYNKVLRDGLPNWKSGLYYYRRLRKMGLAEGAAIVFIIISIGQYFVAWGVYIEKKYTAEQLFGTKLKKLQKKTKANIGIDQILGELPTPSIFNTLPFQIPMAIWHLPRNIKSIFSKISEMTEEQLEKRRREAEELEMQQKLEEELVKERELKKEKREHLRKRKQANVAPEKTEEELAGYSQLKVKEFNADDAVKPVTQSKAQLSGGLWTDEDLVELIRLVKKYPGGTIDRWEIIAEAMNRSVSEVTFMAAKLKDNGYRIPGHTDSVAENIVQETAAAVKKVKTKKTTNPILVPETNWTQEQQAALEAAIMKYPKSGTSDRWQKIANNVPGKTKEECLVRYKYLVELIKSQKENKAKSEAAENNSDERVEEIGTNIEGHHKKDDGVAQEAEVEEVEVEVEAVEEDEPAPVDTSKGKGKPRNKRKERKKRMEFSSDEDSE